MAKNHWLIIVLIVFIGLFFLGLRANIPMNYQEVREGYTAYSLGKIGKDTNSITWPLFFRADNNYLSTLGVYLRIPSILLFGLGNVGTRLPGILVGILAIVILYLIVSEILKNRLERILAVICFSFSPLLLQTTLLNLGTASTLVLFLTGMYILILKRKWNKKLVACLLALALIFSIYILKFQPQLIGFIKRESLIQNVLPASYSFEYAKRLSFDQLYGSPLIIGGRNYNRIVFNKYFYGINAVLQSLIAPFNFEKIISPLQSQTILSAENFYSKYLPGFYFWDIPLAIGGFMIYLSRKDKKLIVFWAGLAVSYFFNNSLIFLVPAISVCESICFSFILNKVKGRTRWVLAVASGALFLLGFFVINISLLGNYKFWLDENSLRQYQIWAKITDQDLKQDKIFVTDRLGEPVFYYLFYKKIDPQYYLSNKADGPLLNGEIQRIDSVGTVYFGSFNFSNEKKEPNELWIGLSGEFRFSVSEGTVTDKIKGVSVIDGKSIGDELWFVKTPSQ